MATKVLKLNIINPKASLTKIVFTTVSADGDFVTIPRRYQFTNGEIANIDELIASNYFRQVTGSAGTYTNNATSSDYSSAGDGRLGFALPRTEKLFLLVKTTPTRTIDDVVIKSATGAIKLILKGSSEYGVVNKEFEVAAVAATANSGVGATDDVYEIDLYDMGLYIDEGKVSIEVDDGATDCALALVVRTY